MGCSDVPNLGFFFGWPTSKIGSVFGFFSQCFVLAKVSPLLTPGIPPPSILTKFSAKRGKGTSISSLLMSLNLLTRLIATFLAAPWTVSVYQPGFYREVRLRFKLATGLGVAWTWDGDIPQGCTQSMVFLLWQSMLLAVATWRIATGVTPQLYADNPKCSSYNSDLFLASAQFTDGYVKSVGARSVTQQMCACKRMTVWRNANDFFLHSQS